MESHIQFYQWSSHLNCLVVSLYQVMAVVSVLSEWMDAQWYLPGSWSLSHFVTQCWFFFFFVLSSKKYLFLGFYKPFLECSNWHNGNGFNEKVSCPNDPVLVFEEILSVRRFSLWQAYFPYMYCLCKYLQSNWALVLQSCLHIIWIL